MCKILKNLSGRSAEEIIERYHVEGRFPIDIAKVAKEIGITLGSINFSELEKNNLFKEMVEQRGHILGAVYIDGDAVKLAYHDALIDDTKYKHLSETDLKEKLHRRQRFTIAHEIAHCCLHMKPEDRSHIEYRTEQMDYKTPKERDANIFAGKLLIPFDILQDICSIFSENVPVGMLADLFRVSRSVMKARVDYLKEEGFFADKVFV